MKSQETLHYIFQGFNISDFEFTIFLITFSLFIAFFCFDNWMEWIVNSAIPAIPISYLWVSKMFRLITFQNRHFLDNPQYRKKVFKGTSAWEGGRWQYRDPDTINFIAPNSNIDIWNNMLLGHFTYKIITKIHTEPSGKVDALSLSINLFTTFP